jgi:hypothetical protein
MGSGGVCRDVAGSGLGAGQKPRRRGLSPLLSMSWFPGVWARIGHGRQGDLPLDATEREVEDRSARVPAVALYPGCALTGGESGHPSSLRGTSRLNRPLSLLLP